MRICTSMASLRVNFPEAEFVPLITELLSLAAFLKNASRAMLKVLLNSAFAVGYRTGDAMTNRGWSPWWWQTKVLERMAMALLFAVVAAYLARLLI